MKPHKHAELIKAWADGHEVEYLSVSADKWLPCQSPYWADDTEYRIHDPYRHLKEAAADPTKQIRINGGVDWIDAGEFNWTWTSSPSNYEIRYKPVEKRKVKLLAWLAGGNAVYREENENVPAGWKRIHNLDYVAEVDV